MGITEDYLRLEIESLEAERDRAIETRENANAVSVRIELENQRLRSALVEIARRPTVERNPDGEDQAAATMQLVAREALATNQNRQSEED